MLVFFFPFFWKISAVTYTTACARAYGYLFLKGISAAVFSLRSCTACARACSRCACACPRGTRGRPRRLGCSRSILGGSAAMWTNVVWPIKSRQTNKPTNKHTLLFYRYRLADHAEPCSATVPSQHWAAEKQT